MQRFTLVAPLLALACLSALASCDCRSRAACAPACTQECITHVVLIDVADDAEIAALRSDADAQIPKIAGVCGYQCGAPIDIGRTTVTGDYDLGMIVQFPSVDAYKAYLEAPAHKELVAKWRPKWKSSRIFDFGTARSSR